MKLGMCVLATVCVCVTQPLHIYIYIYLFTRVPIKAWHLREFRGFGERGKTKMKTKIKNKNSSLLSLTLYFPHPSQKYIFIVLKWLKFYLKSNQKICCGAQCGRSRNCKSACFPQQEEENLSYAKAKKKITHTNTHIHNTHTQHRNTKKHMYKSISISSFHVLQLWVPACVRTHMYSECNRSEYNIL